MGATPNTAPAICRVLLAQRGNTNRFITKNRGWSRALRRAPREFVGRKEHGEAETGSDGSRYPRLHDRATWVCPWCRKSERVRRLRSDLLRRVRAYALAPEKCK